MYYGSTNFMNKKNLGNQEFRILLFFFIKNILKMASSSNNNNMDKWDQWIEDAISKYCITCHEYDEFQNIERIGSGKFSEVYRANWKSKNTVVILKSFKNDICIAKEIVNEVNNNRNY